MNKHHTPSHKTTALSKVPTWLAAIYLSTILLITPLVEPLILTTGQVCYEETNLIEHWGHFALLLPVLSYFFVSLSQIKMSILDLRSLKVSVFCASLSFLFFFYWAIAFFVVGDILFQPFGNQFGIQFQHVNNHPLWALSVMGVYLWTWGARFRKLWLKCSLAALYVSLTLFTIIVYPPFLLLDSFSKLTGVITHLPTEKPVVYLTIDDAPSKQSLVIGKLLQKHNAQATFFIEGQQLEEDELLKVTHELTSQGHNIGNHQYSRRVGAMLSAEEFQKELEDFDQAAETLRTTNWFRPANGFVTPSMLRTIKQRGQTCVLGDCFPWDYVHGSGWFNIHYIFNRLRPGSIIILHDGPGRAPTTIITLARLLHELEKRGFEVHALPEQEERASQ